MWRESSFCSGGACVQVDVDWRQSTKCGGGDCVQVGFRKSSASADTANCVEVAYRKASLSTTTECVEVAGCTCNEVRVRDSKDPDGPVLVFTRDEFTAFTAGVKAGEFDL